MSADPAPSGAGADPLIRDEQHGRAVAAAIMAALMWSSGGILIRMIPWDPIPITGFRSIAGSLFLLLLFRRPRFTWSIAQVGGAFAFAIASFTYSWAIKHTAVANVVVLQNAAPIYVAVLGAILLRERPKGIDWATMGIMLGGIGLFFAGRLGPGTLAGNLAAVVSGVFAGLLTVAMRGQKNGSPIETILLGNAIMTLFAAPSMLRVEYAPGPLLLVALLGLVHLAIPFVFFNYAVKRLTAIEMSLLRIAEPVLSPLWVFLAMGEQPGLNALFGGTLVLCGLTLRSLAPAFLQRRTAAR